MTQDERTPLPLRHIARFGWPLPRLAGGAPDEDDPAGDAGGTANGQAPPEGDPPAGSSASSVELPFKLEDVADESQRAWLTGRQAQMQAGYDRELNRLREEVAPLRQLRAQLDNEETRDQALSQLLEPYGYTLDDDTNEAEPGTAEEPPAGTPDPELVARLDALEAERLSDKTTQREQQFLDHVEAGVEAYADALGLGEDAELPAIQRDQLIANALALPRLDSGLLDMQGAITATTAQQAAARELERESYLASKDVPNVQPNGGSGEPAVDLSNRAARLARAEAVAGRHL